MISISMAFLIAALVIFIIGAVGVAVPKVNLTNAGLACVVAAMLVGKF